MFKFFRRYNKWILAIGGSLLLIAFLMADIIPQMAGQAGLGQATWARVGPDERVVTQEERQRVARELDVLRVLNPEVRDLFEELGVLHRPEHWYLLAYEAEQAGLVAGPSDALQLLGPDAEQQLSSFSQATGFSRDFLLRTFSRINGVHRLFREYQGSVGLSDTRVRNEAAQLFHRATADLVVITAEEADDYEPSDDELQAHLDQYGDVAPGSPEHPFGYRLPDRVKLEWITVSIDDIRDAVRDSDEMSRIELWQHWQRNEDRFGSIEDGADIPDEVREDRLETLVDARREELNRFAIEELRRPRRGLDRTAGYYDLPDDWDEQMLPLDELALRIQEEHKLPLPEYHSTGGDWIAINELETLGPIGTAGTEQFGEEQLRLPRLVQAARELNGEETIPIQTNVAGPPLDDEAGNMYFFRLLDIDASRPPQSVDEVRTELVRDLRRKHHYEQLRDEIDSMRELAADRGLLRLALNHGTRTVREDLSLIDPQMLEIYQMMGMPPAVMPTPFPKIGEHRQTLETIIERSRALADQYETLDAADERERVVAVPVNDRLAVVVARIVSSTPLTEEEYREQVQAGLVQQIILAEELQEGGAFLETFAYDAMAERHNFRLSTRVDDGIPVDDPAEGELDEPQPLSDADDTV